MIDGWDYDVINQVPLSKKKGLEDSNLYAITTKHEWDAFFKLLMTKKLVACDTETTGFDYFDEDHIVGMSFGWEKEHFYIPVRHVASYLEGEQIPHLDMEDLVEDLQTFFAQKDIFLIGHNFKFDMHFFKKEGIDVLAPFHDTTILWHLYDENAPKALKVIASGWTDVMRRRHKGLFGPEAAAKEKELSDWRSAEAKDHRTHFSKLVMKRADELATDLSNQDKNRIQLKKWIVENELSDHPDRALKKDAIHYGMVPIHLMTEYAAIDTFLTYALYTVLREKLVFTKELLGIYINEIKLSRVLFDSEERGTLIGEKYLNLLEEELSEECRLLSEDIYSTLGGRINFNSSDQLASALEQQGVVFTKKTKRGKWVLDQDILEKLGREYPIIQDILYLRGSEKILKTYVHGIQRKIQKSPYIHMNFNQNVTTGRMSCSAPNCFDGSTEVLTPEGWVSFASYKNQKVAQWSEDGSLSFVTPLSYYKGRNSLLNIRTRAIDLCVTPDHRCLIQNRKTEQLKVVEAKDYPEDYRQLQVGELDGSFILNDDNIILACAVQADSYLTKYDKYDFKLSKDRKITRLRDCLNSLSLPYKESKWAKGYRFYVDRNDITDCLGGKFFNFNKLISLSLNCKRFFADEVMFWDGCYSRLSMYTSKEKSNADAVQAVLSSAGIRARLRKYTSPKGSVSWQIDRVNKAYSLTTNRKIEELPVSDVYCVSVPSSYLMVRRNQNVSVTGNCQNIPRGDARIRKAFLCPPDYYFIFADYSQVEVRLTAHYSEDPIMLDAYAKNQDIHTRTACEMFDIGYNEMISVLGDDTNVNYDEFNSLRDTAKRINFGIIYGVGAPGLSHQIPRPERFATSSDSVWIDACQAYIDQYFLKYKYVKRFINRCTREVKSNAEITSYFGRVRHLPTINAYKLLGKEFSWMSGKAERQAANFVIQSTAADVFKFATVRVAEEVFKGTQSYIVNLVHDEIQSYIHKDELFLLNKKKDVMEDFDFLVPLNVDFAYSTESWANKKGIKA